MAWLQWTRPGSPLLSILQRSSAVQCSAVYIDRPAGGVDRVPEETVARHPGAHHAGAAGPGVKPDPDPQPLLRLVSALSQSRLSLLVLDLYVYVYL